MNSLFENAIRLKPLRLVILILMLLGLSACSSDERTESERTSDARASVEKYRYREAIIEMRNLLRKNPKNMDARLILGEALLATGDMATAQKEAFRARDLGATPERYAETLARALQGTSSHIEVIAEIDTDSISDPVLASTLRALRGRSMLELQSVEQAESVFDAELAAGDSVEAQRIALLGKAAIAAAVEDFNRAEEFARYAIDLVPDSPESALALGRIYLSQDKFENARELLGKARGEQVRARRQDWFFIEAQYTEALLGLGELANARESTSVLVDIGHSHPMAVYLLGRVEFESGNTNKAIEHFQQVLSEYPSYAPAQTLMGIAMIQREDFDQAEMHLAKAVSNNPENVRARRLLAETRLRMGRDAAAVRTLRDGLSLNSADADLLTMLGRARMRGGEDDDGLRHLQEAYARAPQSIQAGLALASAHLSTGDSDEAIRIINSLPEQSIDEKRRQILIRVAQLDNSDQEKAEIQIEELLEDAPGDTYVIGLAGSFYAATDQTERARAKFEEILNMLPGNRSAMLNILTLDERIDNYTQSQQLFEAAHEDDPSDLLPTLVLARIYEAKGEESRSLEMVSKAIKHNPSALLPNLMLSAHALREGNHIEAERYSAIAVKEYPDSARAHALSGFAKMHLGKLSESKSSFQRAVILSPDTLQYRYFLGKAAWANGQLYLARTSFMNVLRDDKAHLPAMRSLGILQADMGKMAQADKLVEDIQTRFGQIRPALVAVGEIRAAQGNTQDANVAFEAAQEVSVTWPVALELYKLRNTNNLPDPTQPLREWKNVAPEDPRPHLKTAQHHHAKGDSDLAITEYEKTLSLQPDSVVSMNNLAWLYFERAGDDDQHLAIAMAQKAFELSDRNASIADTYGWLLFRAGKVEESRAILRDAFQQTSASRSPEIGYHYAAVLEHKGLMTSAQTLLEAVLKSDQPFSSRAEAKQLYDSLIADTQ